MVTVSEGIQRVLCNEFFFYVLPLLIQEDAENTVVPRGYLFRTIDLFCCAGPIEN